MISHSLRGGLISAVSLICVARLAAAQTPPPAAPDSPSLPRSSAVKIEMEPSLIVLNARGASLQGDTLTLIGVSTNSIIFADRPVRAAGHLLTKHVLEEWGAGWQLR